MKSAHSMKARDNHEAKQGKDTEKKVAHNYNDYANEVEQVEERAGNQLIEEHTQASMNRGGEQNFPVKLHYMLNELEKDGMDDIVSWQPHGRCFLVHKQQQFVEQVLPLWFRQTKFPSFQRQLNLYGFKRLTSGRDKGGYYHELFLRSKLFLSRRIQRMKIKGTGARKPGSPETEPNFYIAPSLPSTNIPTKNAQVSMIGGTMASGPNMYPGTGGSLSLQQLLAFPALSTSLQHHQAQFAPPPLFHTSANHLMEARQTQARLQRLRVARLQEEMQVLASFGQQNMSMLSDRHASPAMMAITLPRAQQDLAAFANAPGYWRGYLG